MVELLVPFDNTAEFVTLDLGNWVQHEARLIDEVRAWVDDGRITHFIIRSSRIIGLPHLNRFQFRSVDDAMLFKLIYG